ncbi:MULTISPECIES: hypothetical protein [Acinetobacter]|uniref:Lipoprotein n=1 Tax=Acinetobacter kyonggiensis TaxID=595670 RepID=A0A1H3N5Z3_9GAMM|nr:MULTISPECIES: hypothetical protein [Acinetobacter]OTG97603.1 hypothetical protein B9T24_05700 [Acinetobacter sp. ANC 4654]OTH00121.1 hypothetical protein B9T30_05790 [Acinetobacter sp. ANC 4973]SDY83639.1 hypothetical protein SAMN05421643_13618 [Acinetobacter kyonggiensis]
MKKIYVSLFMASSVLLGACATTVKPTYISPTQYQALNCQQLQSEYNRIQQYVDNGVQPAKRTGVGVGVGLGGGWGSRGGWGIGPSVSVNMGQSSNTKNTELARLLGEQEAVVQAAKFKNCPIIIRNKAQ